MNNDYITLICIKCRYLFNVIKDVDYTCCPQCHTGHANENDWSNHRFVK
ncbi:MAG: hypothetical protein ACFFDF_14160 [Candidatus Odinarchaeota archaeon]